VSGWRNSRTDPVAGVNAAETHVDVDLSYAEQLAGTRYRTTLPWLPSAETPTGCGLRPAGRAQ
jgi:hypothetical protein